MFGSVGVGFRAGREASLAAYRTARLVRSQQPSTLSMFSRLKIASQPFTSILSRHSQIVAPWYRKSGMISYIPTANLVEELSRRRSGGRSTSSTVFKIPSGWVSVADLHPISAPKNLQTLGDCETRLHAIDDAELKAKEALRRLTARQTSLGSAVSFIIAIPPQKLILQSANSERDEELSIIADAISKYTLGLSLLPADRKATELRMAELLAKFTSDSATSESVDPVTASPSELVTFALSALSPSVDWSRPYENSTTGTASTSPESRSYLTPPGSFVTSSIDWTKFPTD